MTRGGSGDIGPTGGRSMSDAAATVAAAVAVAMRSAGAMPQSSADAGRTEAALVGLAGWAFGRAPLVRTRIAAPSKVTSTVPSWSVR